MPKVPAPEECATFQEYFLKCAEEQADDWTKRRYIGRAKVGNISQPPKFLN